MAEHTDVVRRREDPRLITGTGAFIDDLRVPGCLHAAMLRSPHAHARIRAIDVSAARKAPGVVGVFTAADLGAANEPLPIYAPHPALPVPCRLRPLATDVVRFVGEPLVAVVADDPYRAWDALDLIAVEYEPLPAVVDVEAALAQRAQVLHVEIGSNVVAEWRQRVGDAETALRSADVVVRTRIRLARGTAHPLEPRGLIARWDGDELTVWAAIQLVHRHRTVFAGQFAMPEERVRVIAPPDVGGGFGTKAMYYPEYIVVAALARHLGQPLKWIETRREHTLVACGERDQIHDVEIAATRDGRLLALRDDFVHDMGAYTISGLNLLQNAMIHSVGPYVIPNLDLRFRGVMTTTTPVGAYRGAGRPYGTAVIERAMDALARELGMDPIELRRRNLIAPGSYPYVTGLTTAGRGPVNYDSGDYPRCLALALEALDLPAARREQVRLRAEGRYLGIGVVNYVEATATAPHESAIVRVTPDGGVIVVTGAAPQGQGHETLFSHLVGELLGVDPDTIDVRTGDTALVARGGGTFGSRTAAIGGSAALLAGRVVRDKARRIAAHLLEASADDLVQQNGAFAVRGLPSRTVTWREVAAAAHAGVMPGETRGLEADNLFEVSQSSFANGTHAVVLEVDPDTGAVQISRWVVAHDCGHVLQPGIVDGQIHGGVVQGLPDALNVQLAYDDAGQRLTATLMDYALATAADAPRSFELRHLESPTPLNPLGAKGAGEGGIMPVHPLIAQAIEDALAPFGARVARVPVTREEIAAMAAAPLRKGGRMTASDRIDGVLRQAVDAKDVPGVVAMAATDKGLLYDGAFGTRDLGTGPAMTLDTTFRIASMTKAVTCVAAMQMVEQGRLKVDEPVPNIDPTLGAPQVLEGFDASGAPKLRPAKRPITLRHLMTHTAGFSYEIWNANTGRYVRTTGMPSLGSLEVAALRLPLAFDPGDKWEYGINIEWVGRLVESVSGQPLDVYVRERIAAPLGMKDTAYTISPEQRARLASIHQRGADGTLSPVPLEAAPTGRPEFYPGGGGLHSTGRDYLAFVQMLLHGGSFNGARLLKPETVAFMHENAIGETPAGILKTQSREHSNDVDLFPGARVRWSLGHMLNPEAGPYGRSAGTVSWGGLFNTYYWIDPAKRVTGLIMTQILPFADRRALALYGRFERAVYDALRA